MTSAVRLGALMARPREFDQRVSTALRLDPDLHQALADAARSRGRTLNAFASEALRFALDHLAPERPLFTDQSGSTSGGSDA